MYATTISARTTISMILFRSINGLSAGQVRSIFYIRAGARKAGRTPVNYVHLSPFGNGRAGRQRLCRYYGILFVLGNDGTYYRHFDLRDSASAQHEAGT